MTFLALKQGGESGFDAASKAEGRKRNLVVDTMGLIPPLKSAIPMVPTVGSALATSNSDTTSASKSYGAQETARRDPAQPRADSKLDISAARVGLAEARMLLNRLACRI